MKNIFQGFVRQNLGPFLAIVVIFIHTIVLERDLECDCMRTGCDEYMAFPFFIILLLQLWVQKTLSCSQVFRKKLCSPWLSSRIYDFYKALCVALLWVVSVLIDGDWYVCCGPLHHNNTHLACKDKSSLKSEEKTTVAALKSRSMIIGMSILLVIVFIGLFMQCCMSCCGVCCSSSFPFFKAVLEKEDKVLTEFMKTKAEETLNQGIEKHIWKEEWKKELIPLTIQEPRTTTAGTRTTTAGTRTDPTRTTTAGTRTTTAGTRTTTAGTRTTTAGTRTDPTGTTTAGTRTGTAIEDEDGEDITLRNMNPKEAGSRQNPEA